MRSQRFEDPRLFVGKAGELPLSGPALLELMRAVLAKGIPFRFRARGWSMTPFIRDGDVITVAPLQDDLPGIGQIIAFVRPETGKLVVHRIIARHGPEVLVQGDRVEAGADGWVPPEALLGRVVRIERKDRLVWLGLGPERLLIAWLSRVRLLIPIQIWLGSLRKRFS